MANVMYNFQEARRDGNPTFFWNIPARKIFLLSTTPSDNGMVDTLLVRNGSVIFSKDL